MQNSPNQTVAVCARRFVLLLALTALSPLGFSTPAFPGAEGFGSTTPGGRGGVVLRVTNLEDSGPGSFRAAVTAAGPRIVVFDVSGDILVRSMISISDPFLTIAGQTAPGEGITIRNDPTLTTMQKPLKVATHDVVLRYLRIRPGAPTANPPLNGNGKDPGNLDALNVGDDSASEVYNVVIDHCSFSWGTDEVLTTSAHDVTLSWNIISEGLDDSTHPDGRHGKGLHLLGDSETDSDNISVHHNLLAHNLDRNPDINTSGIVDLVNNVFYNAIAWTQIKNKWNLAQVNVVGNYYRQGPDYVEGPGAYKQSINGWEIIMDRDGDGATNHPEVYLKGNIGWHRPTDSGPEDTIIRRSDSYPFNPEDEWLIVKPVRFAAPAITETSAVDALAAVLAGAGATRPARDSIDERIVRDVLNGSGNIIDSPDQVGGWAPLIVGSAKLDSDGDGMPDDWERYYGLDPSNAADGPLDANGDGYTNVEEFLNGTVPISPL